MVDYPTLLSGTAAGLTALSFITLFLTGSILSFVVMLALIGVAIYLLQYYGYISISMDGNGSINVDVKETQAPPSSASAPTKAIPVKSIEEKEVFYVGGNEYTYEEAPAVCAAYEAELASYDQIMDAYGKGAEWCGYGWTAGGMALFPTQQSTWEALQQEVDEAKRVGCGRPGVNGGYMNTSTKLGVNCFGVKPKGTNEKLPLPLPGTDPSTFNQMVNKFRSMIKKMDVSPFNRASWSEWNVSAHV